MVGWCEDFFIQKSWKNFTKKGRPKNILLAKFTKDYKNKILG